jgi:hypothetical protein
MTTTNGVCGSAETGGPAIPQPDREGDERADGVAAAQELWDTLIRARADFAPRILAAAEDAVFRFYLPLARTLAGAPATRGVDPTEAEQAAEVGLAQAVLDWQHRAIRGFDAYARAAITVQLRLLSAAHAPNRRSRTPAGAEPADDAQPSQAQA